MSHLKGKAYQETIHHQPPPYLDVQQSPGYGGPRFNGLTSDDGTPIPTTTMFPPALDGYHVWKWKQEYQLGRSAEEKLFRIALDTKFFTKKETFHLHNGPEKKDPIIATASRRLYGLRDRASITLNGFSGDGGDEQVRLEQLQEASWTKSEIVAFSMRIGKTTEEFQWRSTSGKEVRELAGRSSGWKLVRMSGPESGAGGSSKVRDAGFTSDGKEIVALIAHNPNLSMTKEFRFSFMGTGLTGAFGAKWETVAVLSGFGRWWVSITETSGAS